MVKKKLIIIFSTIISILFMASFSFGAQDFSVNPISISLNSNLNTAGSSSITITNSGTSNINLTISKIDLKKGSDTIALTLDKTSITNLATSQTSTITTNYGAISVAGTYTGSIIVKNTQNLAQNKTIPITLTVSSTANSNSNLEILGEGTTITINTDVGNNKRVNLRFRNTGTIDLTNLQFTKKRLTGINSGDRILSSDISFSSTGFDLLQGDSKNIDLRINVPNDISADTYSGTFTVKTNQGYTYTWNLDVKLAGANIDVIIEQNYNDVRQGLLTLTGDSGETLRGYEFRVKNQGTITANNLIFELDNNLVEENSGAIIPNSAVSFIPSTVDLRRNQNDNIEVRVNIPTNQQLGNYFANIRVRSSSGIEYDKILLKVEVVGDVYIKDLNLPSEILPGNSFDLDVTLRNKGLKLHRNVKITATLFDVDNSNTNLIQTTSSFLLDINKEKNQKLKFNIPKDATDGSHTLEIKVSYDNLDFTKIKEINFKRARYNIVIDSFSVNPKIISCDKKIFSFTKIQNLGRYDEFIKVQSEILGTPIKLSTKSFEIKVDEIRQKNGIVDVSNLDNGNYQFIQKVVYGGSLFRKVTTPIEIKDCNKFGIGVSINNSIQEPIKDSTSNTKIKLFGTNIEKSTIYLSSGFVVVVILIIVSLFFL